MKYDSDMPDDPHYECRELIDDLTELLEQAPSWHDRPTSPGLWVEADGDGCEWNQDDIDRHSRNGWPFGRVYGPIPADEEADTK